MTTSRELDEAGGTRAKNLARVAIPWLSFFFSFCCTSSLSSLSPLIMSARFFFVHEDILLYSVEHLHLVDGQFGT